jgi:hypothetical protein
MTTQETNSKAESTEEAQSGWPDLDKLVDEVKAKRKAELEAHEAQRNAALKAAQDADRAWESLEAQRSLDEMAERLKDLGVVPKPVEALAGGHSVALELSRLPKGETAVIRIDTNASRNGPRTTVQVQRGSTQLPAAIISSNSKGELRKTLVDIAQKLLG